MARSSVEHGTTRAPIIVLCGLPGTGKSSIGRRAAKKLNLHFVDLDAAIEAGEGRTIAEIFRDTGESGFRDIESRILLRELSTSKGTIIATGGGAVLRSENRRAMTQADAVVWMTAPVADLERRLDRARSHAGSHRPLLEGDLATRLSSLAEERTPLYAEVSTHQIPSQGASVDVVLARLVALVTDVMESLNASRLAPERGQ